MKNEEKKMLINNRLLLFFTVFQVKMPISIPLTLHWIKLIKFLRELDLNLLP